MSGDSKTQTTAIDPKYQQMQLDNFDSAKKVASDYGSPYTGQLTQGYGSSLDAPQQGYTALSNYQAPSYAASTINRGDIRNIAAGQLSNTDLNPYMNKYDQGVIDTTSGDLARQYGIDSTAANAQATAAGAFGGSRSGILGGQVYDAYNRNLNSTLANLRRDSFTNAQGAALSDIGNRLTADNANAGYDFNVANNNAQYQNQAGQFNANADLQAAGVRSGALGALTGIAGLQNDSANQGLQAQYQEWLRQQQAPLTGQQLQNQTLAGVQAPTTTTQTTTPGMGSMIGTGLQLASLAAAPFTGGASLGMGGMGGGGGMGGMFGSLFGGGGGSSGGSMLQGFGSPVSLASGYRY